MRTLRVLKKMVVLACSLAVVSLSLSLWSATGRQMYTRLYDRDRAEREAANGNNLASLFEDTTPLPGASAPIAEVPNRFMFGLAPSTYPWRLFDPELLSVLTLAGPAVLIGLIEITPRRVVRTIARRLGVRCFGALPACADPVATIE